MKKEGYFEIISDTTGLQKELWYSITNSKEFWENNFTGNYYLRRFENERYREIECATVAEAKQKAQEHFKKTILKLFFKSQTKDNKTDLWAIVGAYFGAFYSGKSDYKIAQDVIDDLDKKFDISYKNNV